MQPLNFSLLNNESEKKVPRQAQRHCKTIRKRDNIKKSSSKIDCLLNCLSTNNEKKNEGLEILSRRETPCDGEQDLLAGGYDDVSDDGRRCDGGEFVPHPVLDDGQEPGFINKMADDATIENFTPQNDSVTAQEYYKQYVPNYNQMTSSSDIHTNQEDLGKKINYMIHLLEEQQNEKTNNVTEELVLYLFLGVFVIFVVDSFARAGKYKR